MREKKCPFKILYNELDRFMPYYFRFINPVIHHLETEEFTLNENQVKVLMALTKKSQLSSTEISHIFLIPKTSLTTIIRSLVKLGLIGKNNNPVDSRKFTVFLTKKGKKLVEEKKKNNIETFKELFKDMTPHEIHRLTQGFSVLDEYYARQGRSHDD